MTAPVHFYRLDTGQFTGGVYIGSDLDANTPPGCGATVGVADWQAQRVDLATGAVVDWQPPAPADDAIQTWAWDEASRRWLASPTPLAVAGHVRADRDQRLAATDWVVLRTIETGAPPSAAWAAYRQALRDVPAQPGFPHTITWPEEPTA